MIEVRCPCCGIKINTKLKLITEINETSKEKAQSILNKPILEICKYAPGSKVRLQNGLKQIEKRWACRTVNELRNLTDDQLAEIHGLGKTTRSCIRIGISAYFESQKDI